MWLPAIKFFQSNFYLPTNEFRDLMKNLAILDEQEQRISALLTLDVIELAHPVYILYSTIRRCQPHLWAMPSSNTYNCCGSNLVSANEKLTYQVHHLEDLKTITLQFHQSFTIKINGVVWSCLQSRDKVQYVSHWSQWQLWSGLLMTCILPLPQKVMQVIMTLAKLKVKGVNSVINNSWYSHSFFSFCSWSKLISLYEPVTACTFQNKHLANYRSPPVARLDHQECF